MTELGLGSLVATLAALGLLAGASRELALAGGLTRRGRWYLAAALGTGVLSFAFKIGATLVMSWTPQAWIHQPLQAAPADRPDLPAAAPAGGRYRWQSLPRVAPAPADNPTTPAKVELGRRLFHDRKLSSTRAVACASCHDLTGHGGADGRALPLGVAGQQGARNSPSVWNAAFQGRLFWDGRAATLEAQAAGPLTHPSEMGMPSLQAVVDRVREEAGYAAAFEQAFGPQPGGDAISAGRLLAALAAFERTLISPDTPYDRFVRGDAQALTAQQRRGMALFESLGCVQCHGGPNFSAASVFDPAAPLRAFPVHDTPDAEALGLTRDLGLAGPGQRTGVWRVPSLRNVALTAPYFHNGSVATLREAVSLMARAQLGLHVGAAEPAVVPVAADSQGPAVVLLPARTTTEDELDAVTAFLQALSDPRLDAPPAPQAGPRRQPRPAATIARRPTPITLPP